MTSNAETSRTQHLVERFANIGVEQDRALLGGQYSRFNRLYDQMATVVQELKEREGDQRRALMALFNHPSMQVRLKAAVETLAVAPYEARLQLRAIAESQWFPQAGDAGMTVRGVEDGSFKPT
jgi:hypothetical protein